MGYGLNLPEYVGKFPFPDPGKEEMQPTTFLVAFGTGFRGDKHKQAKACMSLLH